MFTIERKESAIPLLELRDGARSVATLAPSRGGILTRLSIGGDELLYMDDASFANVSGNVRGGNPVLFPSPGKLENDRYARGAHAGSMKQHGFARNAEWEVVSTDTQAAAQATLRMASTDATRGQYPWDFVVEFTYRLADNSLRIGQRVTNKSRTESMPFGIGFHPYFFVPDAEKSKTRIDTNATRVFDNVTKTTRAFTGFDLTEAEVDAHLLDHGNTESTLARPGAKHRIVLSGSPEFTHWVVWTLKGRDFVCLEPWTCPGNALNSGDRLLSLAPNETRELFLDIAYR